MKRPALLVLAAACSSGHPHIDAPPDKDDAAIDAPSFPAPPSLGAQIDRMGRPAINTALNGLLLPDGTAKKAQKDAYNHAADPAMWLATQVKTNVSVVKELANNLAIFDVLDQGVATITGAGCGNTALYDAPPSNSSYTSFASVLADDELFVDSSKATCDKFLSLEIEAASGGTIPHTQCGGRMPSHDVIDVSYSVLMAGTNGLDVANDLAPRIGDGVGPHADASDTTFPFLGAPH